MVTQPDEDVGHLPLNNRALCFPEPLVLVPSGCVGHERGELWLHSNVILQRNVADL